MGRLAGVLLLVTLCGCGRERKITEISLERKGCLGPCRVYKVTLRADGSATYFGAQGVERVGAFTNDDFWPIPGEFARLAAAVEKAGFFRLADRYNAGTVDAEVVVTSVTRDGETRTVTTHNSAKDPQELWLVDLLIDGVAAEVHWVKRPQNQ